MKFLEIAGNRKRNAEWDVIRDHRVRGGWVHDMTILPIPNIDDSTYDGTYSEHFIEHLTKEQGIAFLKEMYRVLKPGGVIRIVWPSMDFINMLNSEDDHSRHPFVEMYNKYILDRENPFNHPYYRTITDVNTINRMSKQKKAALRLLHQEGEHKHLWYVQELVDALKEVGFNSAQIEPYRSSRLEQFINLDSSDPMRTHHSSVVEGTR
jgi:predicted SAM-dependent methyltransferase